MVYANAEFNSDLFTPAFASTSTLLTQLTQIFTYRGEFIWTQNAIDEINAWNRAKCPPTPNHSKLAHYNARRALHTIKLSMISAASRSGELQVTIDDFERAKDWLLAAEVVMPDIFRAMGQKSDSQVIMDMHYHI
jgi:hypothetical protein